MTTSPAALVGVDRPLPARLGLVLDSSSAGRDYGAARAAGLASASAYRWAIYVQWCGARGRVPVSLEVAVEQKRRALAGVGS